MRMKDLEGVSTGNLFRAHPSLLKEEPGFNIRAYHGDDYEVRLENYTNMFLAGSEPPPLKVRLQGEEIFIIDGHVRWKASLQAIERGAEIKSLPLVQFTGNDRDRVVAMIQSGMGRGWSPLELLEGYRRLINYGWTEREIAKQLGKTEQHVHDIMALATADVSVQTMIKEGLVSATLAIETVRRDEHKAVETLTAAVAQAKKEGKSKATAKHVATVRGEASGREVNRGLRDLRDVVVRQAEEAGVTDSDFEDHVFQIEGRYLKLLLQSK